MKKRFLLLPVITLLLGGLAFFTKPKAESASATDEGSYHLFVQIQSKDDGAYQDNYNVSERATLTTSSIEADTSIWIIAIIASVSIASLTVLVILKKRERY